jgi:hypothetical protein
LPLLIATDVDGRLLDHRSYAFEEARDALQAIGRRGCCVGPLDIAVLPVLRATLDEIAKRP